jgi:WD40 repeat protein/energy-coupling factor transporter ATP-binding protein EcfA2
MVSTLGLSDELPDDLWRSSWVELEPRLRQEVSPYLGLRPFGAADADHYYGRAEQAERLAAAIRSLRDGAGHGVVALVGPSGCGKSSLLAAGIAARECVDGALAGWTVRFVEAGQLDQIDDAAGNEADLVIFDQFEQVLFLPPEESAPILDRLARLASEQVVVVGLRSDAFAAAEAEPSLAEALARPVLVAPMTRAELRAVIVEPATLAGVQVDDELVHVLQNELVPGSADSRVSADVLPLLSNALLATWAAGTGDQMTVADYRAVGGAAGAMETLAEEVYAGLDDEHQAVAQRLFLRLVAVSQDLVLPRTQPLTELTAESRQVVDRFVAARMLTVGESGVRISHEALLRHWARLAGWVEDHRGELAALAKLQRAAELWRDADRDPNALMPVTRMPVFADWLGDPERRALLGPIEVQFLDASEQHFASALDDERRQNQRLRRQRRLALGFAAAATAAAMLAGFAFARGEGYRAEAVTAQVEAQSRQAAVEARSLLAKSPNSVVQLALASHQLADTQEGRSIVLDASAMDAPLRRLGAPNAVLAVSPDGVVVARADGAGKVTIWHGEEIVNSPGTVFAADEKGGSLITAALTLVNGRYLLAVGGTNVRALWDVTATPSLVAALDASDPSTASGFNPQGTQVAFGGASGAVAVYGLTDLAHPTVAAQVALKEPTPPIQVSAVVLDATGRLYVSGLYGRIDRWQLGAKVTVLPSLPTIVPDTSNRPVAARVQALAVSPDGSRLAAGLAGMQVLRWRVGAGASVQAEAPLTSFTSWINAMAFTADGTQLGVASSDQDISLYDAATGAELRRMATSSLETGIGFSADGRPISVGTDGTLLVWSPSSPLWKSSGSAIFNLATDQTRWLAAAGSTDGIALWRLGDSARRMPSPVVPALPAGDLQRGAVAVAPNGTFMVGGTSHGHVLTWPLTEAGAGVGSAYPTGRDSLVVYTTVSPDSTLVAAMEYQGTAVTLYRADGQGRLTLLSTVEGNNPQIAGFSADGTLLAVGLVDNQVALWSLADPAKPVQVGTISGLGSTPNTLDMAPTSARLAVGEASGEVSVWDISDVAKPVRQRSWSDAVAAIYSVDFSPDEKTLMATSGDDLVWGWDLTSEATVASVVLNGNLGRPWDVRFIDNGARFAVSGSTGAVRVWTADVGAATRQLCKALGDPLSDHEWRHYLPGVVPRPVC